MFGIFKKKEVSEADKNRALHQKMKLSWDNARTSTGLSPFEVAECYESALGSVYYRFVNILDIPEERQFEMIKSSRRIELGMSEQYLNEALDTVGRAAEAQNIKQVQSMIADIKNRMSTEPAEDLLIKLGLCLIVRHNENPYTYNAIAEREKLEDMKADPELRSFFLGISSGLLGGLVKGKSKDLGKI